MTPSEARDSLDAVKCFAEIDGDNQMNVILNELMKKWKHSGYKMLYKVLCMSSQKWRCKLSDLT